MIDPDPDSGADRERLDRLLGGPELAWLVERVRRRLIQGREPNGSVVLSRPSAEQRHGVQRLLGVRPRDGSTLTVNLDEVDGVLRRSGACPAGLRAAVELLTGPVTPAAEQAERERSARRAASAPVDLAIAGHPCAEALNVWWDGVQAQGLPSRLAPVAGELAPLLADLALVLDRLPAAGEPLGSFAARVLGHAHDLDDGRALTTLVLGAARAIGGLAEPDPGEGRTAAWRREVWASVGLLRDDLSNTVLALGLPGDESTVTGRMLALLQQAGQPAVLTLRQLILDPPDLRTPADRHPVIRVCENPVLVSVAAQRLGPSCPPLICTSGQPGVAVMHLLRELCGAGAQVYYHGDFDWGGLRIANLLFHRLPIRPWRFDAVAYRSAAPGAGGRALNPPGVVANWDPDLDRAMLGIGTALEEEHVLETLLNDLAQP